MNAGAIDFPIKPIRDQDMSDAVASALKIDRKRRASHELLADIKSWFQSLTTREQQVMSLITVAS